MTDADDDEDAETAAPPPLPSNDRRGRRKRSRQGSATVQEVAEKIVEPVTEAVPFAASAPSETKTVKEVMEKVVEPVKPVVENVVPFASSAPAEPRETHETPKPGDTPVVIQGHAPEVVQAPVQTAISNVEGARSVKVDNLTVPVTINNAANAQEIAEKIGPALRDEMHLLVDSVDSRIAR